MLNNFIATDAALNQQVMNLLATETIQCTALRFDITQYQDHLFNQSGVAKPENLSQWVNKRKAEYLAGRLAAKFSLDKNINIATGKNREPVWPTGVAGSISHNQNIAIAITTHQPDRLLGVDVESEIKPDQLAQIQTQFLNQAEQSFIQSADNRLQPILPTAVFSAKESFFKAAFPVVKHYFDFDAIRCIAADENKLTFRLTAELPTLSPWLSSNDTFDMNWFQTGDGAIVTICTLSKKTC